MKKKSCILLISLALAANTVNVYAYQPKIIGSVLSTDIIAYIDKKPIRSYNYSNSTYVLAKDLRDYGFEVTWNNDARTVNITLPENRTVKEFSADEKQALEKRDPVGIKRYDVFQTDIQTLFDGKPVTSTDAPAAINVDGKTLILFSSLGNHFGRTEWSEQYRIANIYTDGAQLPAETYTTDFGMKYQETTPLNLEDLSIYSCATFPVGTDQMIETVTIWLQDSNNIAIKNPDGTYKKETYMEVNQVLVNTFNLKISNNTANQLNLETPLSKVSFENITEHLLTYMPASVCNTDITLSGQSSSSKDFPDFLSINHKLYVSSQAFAKSLEMTTTFDEFGDGTFEKIEITIPLS